MSSIIISSSINSNATIESNQNNITANVNQKENTIYVNTTGKGDKGDSAYEIAVRKGFEGTEEEWLTSLKGDSFKYEDFTEEQLNELIGPKGDKGDIGLQGPQGIQGIQGPAGKDFSISKTYSSISEMESDSDNIEEGNFVMIASVIEDEDNSKLFVKNSGGFSYICDLSGASGMKGEQGVQGIQGEQGVPGPTGPSNVISIGTVKKGDNASATITGDSPNQTLNLVLPKGDKGDNPESMDEQTGSSLLIEASEYNAKELIIEGKSEQDGIPTPDAPVEIKTIPSIENLLENALESGTSDGITYTVNSDKSVTLNGTATTDTFININEDLTLKAGTYRLSGCPSGGTLETYRLMCRGTGYVDYGTGGIITLSSETTLRVAIAITNGTTVKNLTFKPMITTIAREYIPYGNYIKAKITAKNHFNFSNTEFVGSRIWRANLLQVIPLIKDKDYIFNIDYTKQLYQNSEYVTASGHGRIGIIESDTILDSLLTLNSTGNIDNITFLFKTPESSTVNTNFSFKSSKRYLLVYALSTTYINKFNFNNCMLEQNTELSPYEEYKEKEVLINLQDNELCTKNKLNVVNGLFNKKICKIVLDGTQTPVLASSTLDTVARFVFDGIISSAPSITKSRCYSDYFMWYEDQALNSSFSLIDMEAIHVRDDGLGFGIKINKSIASTVDEIKTWLSENPVAVYYELAEPQTIQLEPTNIPLFEGINHISLVNDLATDLYVKYYTMFKGNKGEQGEAGKDGSIQYTAGTGINITENNIINSVDSFISVGVLPVDESQFYTALSDVTLSLGQIFNINFPTSESTDYATLSIDGGNNSYYIVDINNTKIEATELSGKYLTLYFDGSCFVIFQEPISTVIVRTIGTDLNDYTKDGTYYFSTSSTPINIPSGENGWLHVMLGINTIKQIWYRTGTINSNDWLSYVRTRTAEGNWSSWRRLIVEDDIYYKSGDIFKNNLGINVSGYLSGSNKTIEFCITVPKSLANINTITINSLKVNIRHVGGGYIYNTTELVNEENLTIQARKATDNMILITITSTKTYSAINNTPLSVYFYSNGCSLSFS